MKIKLLLIGLLLMVVLSAGCIDFTVYTNYEEVKPSVMDFTGIVENPWYMDFNPDGQWVDFGRFDSGESGSVTFRNTNDPFTKTAYETPLTFIIDIGYVDMSANGVNGKLIVNIIRDDGYKTAHPITLIDYDGFAHTKIVSPDYSFSDYDTNGDGIISVEIAHSFTDPNVVGIYYVKMGFNYDDSAPTEPEPPTPPTETTGGVEFYTDPSGAKISVDGTYKGTSSLLVSGLSAGTHSWSISKTGYNTKTGTVNVIAGENTVVMQTLTAAAGEPEPEPETPTPTANTPPHAVITAVQPSQSMIVFNSDKSTDSDGSIVSREWKLNGKVVTNAVQYQFTTSDKETGAYTVQLTVTDNDGATGTAQYIITLEGKTITDTQVVTTPISEVDAAPTTTEEEPEMPLTFTIPGFEAVFALVGLLAVVWLIKRDEE